MRRVTQPPNKKIKADSAQDVELSSKPINIALIRAPLMPLLQVDEGPRILFKAFKSPLEGHIPGVSQISMRMTLGCRPRISKILKDFPQFKSLPIVSYNIDDSLLNTNPLILFKPQDENDKRSHIEVEFVLTKWLREHQRQGVQFIFDCLMGLKDYNGEGCILADDMGLGKTLQSITVMWTLLNQGLYGHPAVQKCVIICPASLVNNWAAEIEKWLGGKCVSTAVSDSSKDKVISKFLGFRYDKKSRVLISSYETFRMHVEKLQKVPIELIICDEAHRLKNDRTKTAIAISQLTARKRLLISGTPIQNDLDEFYAMVSLCNPEILGDSHNFRKTFANPILIGREPDATEEQQKLAFQRLNELSDITNLFILRRTNSLLAQVLPPKIVMNVFCRLTPLQFDIYQNYLESKSCKKLLQTDAATGLTGRVLSSIQGLMKLCNHPLLLRSNSQTIQGFEHCNKFFDDIERDTKKLRIRLSQPEMSGKFLLVSRLLAYLRSHTKDRVVIISNYTQTLDLFERLCRENAYPVSRLDGSTSLKKRHSMVTEFNDLTSFNFVFLLSSKAGGCGINLIGANRLIMYDPDWNPANDKQALARIWRDGQRKTCFIYRLFSTGTIEEKIYQRQICKDGLSTMLVGEGQREMKDSLGEDIIKNLFTLRQDTTSDTHEMLSCTRCPDTYFNEGQERDYEKQLDPLDEEDLLTWGHHHNLASVPDAAMKSATSFKSFSNILQPELDLVVPQLVEGDFQPVSFVMSCRIEFDKANLQKNDMEKKVPETISKNSCASNRVMGSTPELKHKKKKPETGSSEEDSDFELASGSENENLDNIDNSNGEAVSD